MIDADRFKLLDTAMECLLRTPTHTIEAYLPVLKRWRAKPLIDNAPTLSAFHAQRAKSIGLRVVGQEMGSNAANKKTPPTEAVDAVVGG